MQKLRKAVVELLLGVPGLEVEGASIAPDKADMARFLNLAAKGAMADWLEAGAQSIEGDARLSIRKVLSAEGIFAAEMALVYHRDDAIQFHQRVLERRSGQQDLEPVLQGFLEVLCSR